MTPHAHPVGPFPPGVDPDSYDRLRRRVLWMLPTGLYLLGSRSGERRNLMACNWVTQLATEPKLVGVGVEVGAYTHELLASGKVMALSILPRSERAVIRRFVKPAEHDVAEMTLNGLGYIDAPVTGAPIARAAVAYLDMRVVREVALGSHTLFVGEVAGAGAEAGAETAEVLAIGDTRMSYGG